MKIRSRYSGVLEIRMDRGQKVLDSRNTSYSYGNLQKVWDKVLESVSLANAERILVLGMGGGSVIQLLREKYRFKGRIVAVELDPVIVQLARTEFGIKNEQGLRILCMDAADYVKKRTAGFDLILVDLFIDDKVPEPVLKQNFWDDLGKHCKKNGRIFFNAFQDESRLMQVTSSLQNQGFTLPKARLINRSNYMLEAIKAVPV